MFVRFETIKKPNSYNDSPITSLSWMKNDAALENVTEGRSTAGQAAGGGVVPDLQSPTTMHHHHFGEIGDIDLNNNVGGGGGGIHHEHNHFALAPQQNIPSASSTEDTASVGESEAGEYTVKDGWLAVGNTRGIVGVSYTTTRPFDFTQAWATPDAGAGATPKRTPFGTPRRTTGASSGLPQRTNYNLRGHRAEILFVRWNERYQKLATCDENGVIFIWIKYEGRWSIELINDRNTRVTDIAWSHDGRMALISYMDGFVLVGSVSGQRYWSSMLNLNDTTITCGVWTPDDQHVIFGTSNGHLLVISVHGTFVTQVSIQECLEITGLSWSCPKFSANPRHLAANNAYLLAVAFVDGTIFMMKNYDDLDPKIISTECMNLKLDWSRDGKVLAVGGHRVVRSAGCLSGFLYSNLLNFYSRRIFDDHSAPFPIPPMKTEVLRFEAQPLSAIAWGNADQRLYAACGQVLLIGWVSQCIPTLNFLSRLQIASCIGEESKLESVPVPEPIKCTIKELFSQTVCCYLPDYRCIREFVFRPPTSNFRLYCTLMRHDLEESHGGHGGHSASGAPDSSSTVYVLYLEYMGGLVPILKGKRSSKLKTEFIIYDPDMPREVASRPPSCLGGVRPGSGGPGATVGRDGRPSIPEHLLHSLHSGATSDASDGESESFIFPYLTPKTQRRLRVRNQLRRYLGSSASQASSREEPPVLRGGRSSGASRSTSAPNNTTATSPSPSGPVMDDLPERNKMVLVASNIWGTKFKFIGVSPLLPSSLGSMTYRTSFLHLQPRQMALVIKELNVENTKTFLDSDAMSEWFYGRDKFYYGSNSCLVSSDSEDEYGSDYTPHLSAKNTTCTNTPAIAPMTPFKSVRNSMLLSGFQLNPEALARGSTSRTVHLEQAQVEANPRGLALFNDSAPFSDWLLNEPCIRAEMLAARLANMNEEFLTLQIAQNEATGRATYSMEMTTGAHNRRQPSREPEYYLSPDESPLDPFAPAGSSSSATSTSNAIPTMVRQFRNQTFQSESPKHVSYLRSHQSLKSSVSKSSSPNVSPIKEIRQKILKESPRKSSVSYCSSEFTASAKTYIENLQNHNNNVCDTNATTPSTTGAPGETMKSDIPFRSVKFKSCSSEAFATSATTGAFSPPMSYTSEHTSITRFGRGGSEVANQTASPRLFFAQPSRGDLFKKADSSSSQNSRPSSALNSCATKCVASPQHRLSSTPVQTYHIYDDTSLFSGPALQPFDLASTDISSSDVTQRRHQFQRAASTSKHSQSFESPLKTPGDPLKDSFEVEENHLGNVEEVVRILSEKLSAAAREKERAREAAIVASASSCTIQGKSSTSGSLARRSSVPHGLITTSATSTPYHTSTSKYSVTSTSSIQGLNPTLASSSSSLATRPFGTSVSQSTSGSGLRWNRSLPATPVLERATKKDSGKELEGNAPGSSKGRSGGRNFFHSPNVMRKMRRKLSYLDCSSDDDASSDEEDADYFANSSSKANSQNSSAAQTPTKRSHLKGLYKLGKLKTKHKIGDSERSNEFSLHNKAPLWNEITQVYQLDFGGRVTQESAKNFQIEHNGKQVMQFGRIDKNAYTLDFEYPFSAVQALAVALANVTQRFK